MANLIYIPRHLVFDDKPILEHNILSLAKCVVIIAEPGAGKTSLLNRLATDLNTECLRAAVYRTNPKSLTTLIIDSLDEVAKLDNAAIDDIIGKAYSSPTDHIILASRASEWDSVRYNGLIKDHSGQLPAMVRLLPFDEKEQQLYFNALAPNKSFKEFLYLVRKSEIESLLGNPLFLRLLVLSFIQDQKVFKSKKEIISDAIHRLAQEHNQNIPRIRLNSDTKIELSEDIFSKLLLAGSTGISINEQTADRDFPFLHTVNKMDATQTLQILDTGLFKQVDAISLHEPVHKVIAEYCAANYLAKRIANQLDNLTLKRCLSIIAPNQVVRDELRGVLAWLAALGNEEIQSAVIKLDPYAILSNGDPSQLFPSSKVKLMNRLRELSLTDPFFRWSDQFRDFSAKKFFTDDVTEHVREILLATNSSSHLKGLVLELLVTSEITNYLENELNAIMLDINANGNDRYFASKSLNCINNRNHIHAFDSLMEENSHTSLELIAGMIAEFGISKFDTPRSIAFFKALVIFFPTESYTNHRYGSALYIRKMVESFNLADTVLLLDQLTSSVTCICQTKKTFECKCKTAISKVIGFILDNFFEKAIPPFNAEQIWRWTMNLIFSGRPLSSRSSHSVSTLKSNNKLRQEIHQLAFKSLSSREDVDAMSRNFYWSNFHSGLQFQADDKKAIIDHAFATRNFTLWESFFPQHLYFRQEDYSNEFRAYVRKQAYSDAEFTESWKKCDAVNKLNFKTYERRTNRMVNRSQKKSEIAESQQDELTRKFFDDNRVVIESGRDWQSLNYFSYHYLYEPDKLDTLNCSSGLCERALSNCISFIEPSLPTLEEYGEKICLGNLPISVQILQAASAFIYKSKGSLHELSDSALQLLKASEGVPYFEDAEEVAQLHAAITDQLFLSDPLGEKFARSFFEKQLEIPGKFSSNKKEYWETWDNGNSHTIHWGELGTKGQTKEVKSTFLNKAEKIIQKEIDDQLKNGFSEADQEFTLLVEYSVEGMGTQSDVEKRHRLEEKMNELLGWTGLGNCDGGSIGSGTMEVCNFVVNYEIAKQVVEKELAGTEFENYTKIYCEES